jgi:hypothetical protein
MSAYPDAFHKTCVGHLPCGAMTFCSEGATSRGSVPLVLENGRPVGGDNLGPLRPTKITYETPLTHCLPSEVPNDNIQSNLVTFPSDTRHVWVNQRGYGNLVVATNGKECNHIYGKVYPWNRIPPLARPYEGPAPIEYAWANRNVCGTKDAYDIERDREQPTWMKTA